VNHARADLCRQRVELPALEEAIALAEEGLKLSQFCEKQLKEAEGKIEQLVERMGATGVEQMEAEPEGEEEEQE
jgi:exodeoxyribonuclease VII small subunit